MFDRAPVPSALASPTAARAIRRREGSRRLVDVGRLLSQVLTVRCAGCDAPGAPICRSCRFALLATPPRRPGVLVAVPFTGRARQVVLGFKFHNRRAVAGHLAGLVRRRLEQVGVRPGIDVDVVTWARRVADLGAGEILLTSMDGDGTQAGYDLELTRAVAQAVPVPVIASGGAGCLDHIAAALDQGAGGGQASAALLASLLHDGVLTVQQIKQDLLRRGMTIRPPEA